MELNQGVTFSILWILANLLFCSAQVPTIQLQQSSYSTVEGTPATVCVELANTIFSTNADITANLMITAASARFDIDFTSRQNVSILFPVGSTDGTPPVCTAIQTVDDSFLEGEENFLISLSSPMSTGDATLGSNSLATVTIEDNESATVTLSPSTITVLESEIVRFDAVLSGVNPADLETTIFVNLEAQDGTASMFDFGPPLNVVFTFMDNFTQSVLVPIRPDLILESDEYFNVSLISTSLPEVTFGTPSTIQVTILDDDASLTVIGWEQTSYTVREDSGLITICAQLGSSEGVVIGFTIPFTVTAGTATMYDDFLPRDPLEIVFDVPMSVGEESCTRFSIMDDTILEMDHEFTVELVGPTTPPGISIHGPNARTVVTIRDDEVDNAAIEIISMDLFEILERNSEQLMACATIHGVTQIAVPEASVNVTFTRGSAEPGADFRTSGPGGMKINFDPMTIQGCVNIMIIDDANYEGMEDFIVALVADSQIPTGIRFGTDTEVSYTIVDREDATVFLQEIQTPFEEPATVPGSVTVTAQLEVPITGMLDTDLSITLRTMDVTATSPDDYSMFFTVLTFTSGSTTGATVSTNATILPDDVVEDTEDFVVILDEEFQPFTIGNPSFVSIFISDSAEVAAVVVSVMVSSTSTLESNQETLTISVVLSQLPSGGLASSIFVPIAVSQINAVVGEDFTFSSSDLQVTFRPGSVNGTTETIPISILDDTILEGNQSFAISYGLTTPVGITINIPSPVITIIDDEQDNEVVMITPDAEFRENNETVLTACAQINGVTNIQLSPTPFVDMVVNGSMLASLGSDFRVSDSTQATFSQVQQPGAPPTVQGCLSVSIVNDNNFEGDHEFSVRLGNFMPNTLSVGSDAEVVFTITDEDDATIVLHVSSSYSEPSSFPDLRSLSVQLLQPERGVLDREIEVTLMTQNGSALSGEDYSAVSRDLVFIVGAMRAQNDVLNAVIDVYPDQILEGDQHFTVVLSTTDDSFTLATPSMYNVTIDDEDIDNVIEMVTPDTEIRENDQGVVMACAQIRNINEIQISPQPIITMILIGTTFAVDSEDFFNTTSLTTTLTEQFGVVQGCVSINITDDDNYEGDHEFTVRLLNDSQVPPTLQIGSNREVIFTITDKDDATVSLLVPPPFQEPNNGSTPFEVTAVLTTPSGGTLETDVVVTLTTLPGYARAPEDYSALSHSLTFAAGATNGSSNMMNIMVHSDQILEGDQDFRVVLREGDDDPFTLGTPSSVTIYINDADVHNEIVMVTADTETRESDREQVEACAQIIGVTGIQLDERASVDMMVIESALAGSTVDFSEGTSVLRARFDETFGFVEACRTFTILDDIDYEGDHKFTVQLQSNTQAPATLRIGSDDSVVFTITDADDAIVSLQMPSSFPEPDSTPTLITVTAVLTLQPSGVLDIPLVVQISTQDGTAVSGEDYSALTQDLTFPAGISDGMINVTITVHPDQILEGDQYFRVMLSGSDSFTLGIPSNVSIIINDDDVNNEVVMVTADRVVNETGRTPDLMACAQILNVNEIQLTSPQPRITMIPIDSALATNGDDYSLIGPGEVYFSDSTGLTQACADIAIVNDINYEGDHDFTVQLESDSQVPSSLEIGSDNQVVFTITDEADATIQFEEMDSTVEFAEGDTATFEVMLTTPLQLGVLMAPIDVVLTLVDGERANVGSDFNLQTTNAVFSIGEGNGNSSVSGSVEIIADSSLEGTHSFTVTLPTDVGFTIGERNELTVIISDYVDLVAFHFNLVPMEIPLEGTDTTAEVCAVVSFPLATLETDVTVQIMAVDGPTALLGEDYTLPLSLEFSFPTSTSTGDQRCLQFGILDDLSFEGNHEFGIVVSQPTSPPGITIGRNSEGVFIRDDDATVQMLSMDMTTNENNEEILTICAEIPNVNTFEVAASVEMMVMGDSQITPMIDIMAPNGRIANFSVGPAAPACIYITVVNDNVFEGDHQFVVTLTNPSPSELMVDPNDNSITVTITDRDDAVVSLRDESLTGVEGSGVLRCVTISTFSNGILAVDVSFTGNFIEGTATEDDYNPLVQTSTFLAGSPLPNTICDGVRLFTDDLLEGDQVFTTTIESPSTVIDRGATSITIQDSNLQDGTINFTRSQFTGREGDSVMACVELTTLPSGGSEVDITATLSLIDTTIAERDVDYSPADSQTVTFSAGNYASLFRARQCVTLSLLEDRAFEGDHSFEIVIMTVDPPIQIGPPASVLIQDTNTATVGFQRLMYSTSEGVVSPLDICLEISNIPTLESDIVVSLMTTDGTKTSIGADYTLPDPFQVIFPATITDNGDVRCTQINIINDSELEGDDQIFNVVIASTSPMNVVIDPSADQATITIADDEGDDATVGFVRSQVTAMEGQPDNVQLCVRITSIPAGGLACPVEVTFGARQSDGLKEAVVGEDVEYVAPFRAVFDIDTSEGSEQCVMVSIINDEVLEGPHGIEVFISNTSPDINIDSRANAVRIDIQDNDVGVIEFSRVLQYTLPEGDSNNMISACVTVANLPDGGLECDLPVHVESQSGTAVEGEDFSGVFFYVLIPARTPEGMEICMENVSVSVFDDMIVEDFQSFNLVLLTTFDGVSVGIQDSIEIRIEDNDRATVGLTSAQFTGMENSTVMVCVEVSDVPSGGSQVAIDVTLSLSDSTLAVADEDYIPVGPLTVTFPTGDSATLLNTTQCVPIRLLEDTSVEGDHDVRVHTSASPNNVVILGTIYATLTIQDINVATVSLVPILAVSEPVDETAVVTVTIKLDLKEPDELAVPITVPLFTTNDTAVSPTDFSEVTSPFQVIFPVGSMDDVTMEVQINIHPDTQVEGDHHFNVSISESNEYVLGDPSSKSVTIEDVRTTTAFIQLRIQPVPNCASWISVNQEQKMADIGQNIASAANDRCFCDFTQANIANATFNCENQETSVVYNAEITFMAISTTNFDADNLVGILSDWARRGSSLQVTGSALTLDPSCQARSDSISSDDCIPPEPKQVLSTGAIVGIAVGGFVLLVIVVLAIVALCVLVAMKKKKNTGAYEMQSQNTKGGEVVLSNTNIYDESPLPTVDSTLAEEKV